VVVCLLLVDFVFVFWKSAHVFVEIVPILFVVFGFLKNLGTRTQKFVLVEGDPGAGSPLYSEVMHFLV